MIMDEEHVQIMDDGEHGFDVRQYEKQLTYLNKESTLNKQGSTYPNMQLMRS